MSFREREDLRHRDKLPSLRELKNRFWETPYDFSDVSKEFYSYMTAHCESNEWGVVFADHVNLELPDPEDTEDIELTYEHFDYENLTLPIILAPSFNKIASDEKTALYIADLLDVMYEFDNEETHSWKTMKAVKELHECMKLTCDAFEESLDNMKDIDAIAKQLHEEFPEADYKEILREVMLSRSLKQGLQAAAKDARQITALMLARDFTVDNTQFQHFR